MGKYNFSLNMEADDTNPKLIRWMFSGAEVLEFGAANGRMTKYLSEKMHCKVDIVEIDEEAGNEAKNYARIACIGAEEGNVEKDIWEKKLVSQKYDFIVFADVLEHLFHPADVLERCKKFLKKNGKILASIPNMANNAIIYQLLNDEFEYKETGLLDWTHVHFFTMKTFRNMVSKLGFYIVAEDAVCRQLDETEFGIQLERISEDYREVLAKHRTGVVYQGLFQLSLNENEAHTILQDDQLENNIFFSRLFYKKMEDKDFLVENSIVKTRCNAKTTLEFELNQTVTQIRFDVMYVPGMIRIGRIEIQEDGAEFKDIEYVTNGRCLGNGIYVFATNEPQILFDNLNRFVKKITISFEVLNYAVKGMEYIVDVIDNNEAQKQEILVERQKILDDCRKELETKNGYIGALENEVNVLKPRLEALESSVLGKIYYKLEKYRKRNL